VRELIVHTRYKKQEHEQLEEESLSHFYLKFTRLIKGSATLRAIMDEQSMMPEVVQGQARSWT